MQWLITYLLYFWEETRTSSDPHIMIGLWGRFKGEEGHRWHCLRISDETRSGIRARMWIDALLHRRVNIQGREKGYLLFKPGRPSEKASFERLRLRLHQPMALEGVSERTHPKPLYATDLHADT